MATSYLIVLYNDFNCQFASHQTLATDNLEMTHTHTEISRKIRETHTGIFRKIRQIHNTFLEKLYKHTGISRKIRQTRKFLEKLEILDCFSLFLVN